jgi:hypothetical protein
LDLEAMHAQLKEHWFKLGDKVRYVEKYYPAVYNEDGIIKKIAPHTNVLKTSFKGTLEDYVDYDLSAGDCLDITTLGYATTQYLEKGVNSLDQQVDDPDFKKAKDWGILDKYIFSNWVQDCKGNEEELAHARAILDFHQRKYEQCLQRGRE